MTVCFFFFFTEHLRGTQRLSEVLLWPCTCCSEPAALRAPRRPRQPVVLIWTRVLEVVLRRCHDLGDHRDHLDCEGFEGRFECFEVGYRHIRSSGGSRLLLRRLLLPMPDIFFFFLWRSSASVVFRFLRVMPHWGRPSIRPSVLPPKRGRPVQRGDFFLRVQRHCCGRGSRDALEDPRC